jgi:carboxypeptidase Q
VTDVHTRAGGGSDHVSFDAAGVPACMMRQEIAGYRFGHHSQADTLTLAREPNLIQGAQVMAVAAMRIANLDTLLPREVEKKNDDPKPSPKRNDR